MNFGFNTAVRSLMASQRGIYIAGHNMSNTKTPGYSRQVGYQRATTPFYLSGTGYLGTGVEVYNVERVRNSYVDFKYWNESAPLGEWQIKRENLYEIEKLFGEPSKSSFRQYLDDFYSSLDHMSQKSEDPSYREPVRENALAFTKHINESAIRLQNLRRDAESSIDGKVKNINALASEIAVLNKQIYSSEVGGRTANDLRDRRDVLLDKLSKIANIKVDEFDDGKTRVSISGISLVEHDYTSEIKVVKDGTGLDKTIKLEWGNESDVKLRSGELKGLIELYNEDGEGGGYRGIPYYQKKLDEFAKGFADKFNEQHRQGKRLGGADGGDFFTYDGANGIAASLTLDDAILDDLRNIAAGGPDGTGAHDDNRNLLALIAQREDREFFGGVGISQGTPDDFLKAIISNLAVDSLQGIRMSDSQDIMLKNVQFKRDSISSVNSDEEMTDIVSYQHIYIASARMVTTIDTIMDVTINRLGLVGR